MKNLPSKILNYFATFTETRFNFRRLINYKWTNNELTLDLSFFPEFQKSLLNRVELGDLESVTIKQNQHTINLDKEEILVEINKLLQSSFSANYLDECINKERSTVAQNSKVFVASNNGLQLADGNEGSEDLLAKQEQMAQKEGLRTYNLALRRQLEKTLNELQDKLIEQRKIEYNLEYAPPSIFGVTNYIVQHFEQIKKITNGTNVDSSKYIKELAQYFKDNVEDIVIYDLYYNFQKYLDYIQLGTLYIFFHLLERGSETYPLYFLEVECRSANSEVILSFPRDLILLNTPAVNYFKFESVLTVPRASSISKAKSHLGAIETFIQTQYGFQEPFILESSFKSKTHSKEEFPKVKNRIGLQVVTNEDKKLLDYSELMTKAELGDSSKFSGFIDDYVQGTVPNHQEEVDRKYTTEYSAKSAKRYIPDGPIPVNNSQKRILLALANEKNNIIVVDGPPGTGKSHTLAALTYWANEQNKSVVITSHKKEALDVIDRMLTDKYKDLHPQSKPSIARMDKDTGSVNSLQNTLQSSVVTAANERVLEYNPEAVDNDKEKLKKRLEELIASKLQKSSSYEELIEKNVKLDFAEAELSTDQDLAALLSITPNCNAPIDFKYVQEFKALSFTATSLDEFAYILDNKGKIPEFLEACEKLNKLPAEVQNITTTLDDIPADFQDLLDGLKNNFKRNIKIVELTSKDDSSNWFEKIIGKGPKKEELNSLLDQIKSLKFANLVREIATTESISVDEVTIDQLVKGVEKIYYALSIRKYQYLVDSYKETSGKQDADIASIYERFRKYGDEINSINDQTYNSLSSLFEHYGQLLHYCGINSDDLGSLAKLTGHEDRIKKLWIWIQLHYFLSQNQQTNAIKQKDKDIYFKLKQREIEHLNDNRLKNLNNHLGEMAKIKVSYEGGKRFTEEETKILLEGVSCVIAEPNTISKHFPMEEGLIDILIIDEASQVSIADSISLILRAKQVVIFGDEYQYGAVSATNVNSRYSTSYFSEIVSAYADDYNKLVSEVSKQELIDDIAQGTEQEDEQRSDELLKPQDGTVLWLKTFNIRTSTLTFAKAIANYTASLKEHFRSFPEIISYSNEFFYKPAQMELVVNRIRTKPINEVLQFISVTPQGRSGPNTNLDEIETIINDIQRRIDAGFKGTIGVITSFKEQQARLEQALNDRMNLAALKKDYKLAIWFVGDVQGEERDLIYYSFVESKELHNSNLASIYPVLGGTADNIRSLKMQRLNVGFSRAKDTMVFVHSQPIEDFSNTRLGDALKHYKSVLERNQTNDFFIEDESIFDSPMEKKLYGLLLNTRFVKENRDQIKIVPQFDIGKYIATEYQTYIPKYRTDFLLTYSDGGKDQTLILEYDGLEYHFTNSQQVDEYNFSQSYIDYDTSRQLELESYGYRFLRINKFNLRPQGKGQTETDVLNNLLEEKFQIYAKI